MSSWQCEPRCPSLKVVLVGHSGVGKTSLCMTLHNGEAPRDYIPTVDDVSKTMQRLDDTTEVELALFDTAGSEDYDRLRPLSYVGANCFLLCFSVADRANLWRVVRTFWPEVTHHVPSASLVLVGTKIDLRHGAADAISFEEGEQLAREIAAEIYVECSAHSGQGVAQVLQVALLAAFEAWKRPPVRKKACSLV
jgi:small GTP-binding protein